MKTTDTPAAAAEGLAECARAFIADPTDEQKRKAAKVALLRYESIVMLSKDTDWPTHWGGQLREDWPDSTFGGISFKDLMDDTV